LDGTKFHDYSSESSRNNESADYASVPTIDCGGSIRSATELISGHVKSLFWVKSLTKASMVKPIATVHRRSSMSKNQASKSDPRDSLGSISKDKQKAESAHVYQGQRTSLDVNESKNKTVKRKPQPAHQGPRSVSDERETITKRNLETR
jgi:hypothetical protein